MSRFWTRQNVSANKAMIHSLATDSLTTGLPWPQTANILLRLLDLSNLKCGQPISMRKPHDLSCPPKKGSRPGRSCGNKNASNQYIIGIEVLWSAAVSVVSTPETWVLQSCCGWTDEGANFRLLSEISSKACLGIYDDSHNRRITSPRAILTRAPKLHKAFSHSLAV